MKLYHNKRLELENYAFYCEKCSLNLTKYCTINFNNEMPSIMNIQPIDIRIVAQLLKNKNISITRKINCAKINGLLTN